MQDTVYGFYSNAGEYIRLEGHGRMKLTKSAALEVIDELTSRCVYVRNIDAGYWRNPVYEERCEYGFHIQDNERTITVGQSNKIAKEAIETDCDDLDAFIVSELR